VYSEERREISGQKKRTRSWMASANCQCAFRTPNGLIRQKVFWVSWGLTTSCFVTFKHKRKEKNMSSARKRNDLIDFVIDATKSQDMVKKFLKIAAKDEPEELYKWFQNEKYKDIPLNDCKDILRSVKKMHGRGLTEDGEPVIPISPGGGQPVDPSDTRKGY
jgi:hypothetical protein